MHGLREIKQKPYMENLETLVISFTIFYMACMEP